MTVRLNDYYQDFKKHGKHDQSSHGRKKGGGAGGGGGGAAGPGEVIGDDGKAHKIGGAAGEIPQLTGSDQSKSTQSIALAQAEINKMPKGDMKSGAQKDLTRVKSGSKAKSEDKMDEIDGEFADGYSGFRGSPAGPAYYHMSEAITYAFRPRGGGAGESMAEQGFAVGQ